MHEFWQRTCPKYVDYLWKSIEHWFKIHSKSNQTHPKSRTIRPRSIFGPKSRPGWLQRIDPKRHPNQPTAAPKRNKHGAFWPRGGGGEGVLENRPKYEKVKKTRTQQINTSYFSFKGGTNFLKFGGLKGLTFTLVLWKMVIKMLGNK